MACMDNAIAVYKSVTRQRKSLRIAVVTETFPPEINGVAITISRMLAGLRERHHQVQLIRPRQSRYDRPTVTHDFCEGPQRGFSIPRYDILKVGLPANALVRLWSAKRPDIVHLVTEGPLGWSALNAAIKLDLPCSSDFHTNFHSYTRHYGVAWLHKPIAAYLRRFHNRAGCTLVPTAELRYNPGAGRLPKLTRRRSWRRHAAV